MTKRHTRACLAVFTAVLLAPACGTDTGPNDLFPADFTETWREYPLIRYANGQVTLNDRCPVRRDTLNRRLPPLFVNGEPVGFC